MRERDVEAYLVKRVRDLGGEVRKVQWIGRVGAPDRLVMLPHDAYVDHAHCCIWVELKAPSEKARPSQVREHERMRAMGQRVVVIDSIDGVEELLA
jgi:hypothetical protein